jgi:glutamine amidotransferase
MSLLFGYMANEPERIACALQPVRAALTVDVGRNPDGFGIGFFQGGEVLLQKRPKTPPGVVDFYELLRGLRTDVALGHIRAATVGTTQKNENTHPYRFRSWLFAHSGTLPRFDAIRDELLESVPDFLRRNIRGETDSEHIFHLFLAFLHDAGKLDDPNLSVDTARNAARATLAFLDRLASDVGGGPSDLAMIATNGRQMIAISRGKPMAMRKVDGIVDCPVCRERVDPGGRDPKRVVHEHLRAVLLVANGAQTLDGPGVSAVPDGSIVTITHAVVAEIAPLKVEPA